MAVFVCGLDETSGRHQRDKFFMGGFVAYETEWTLTLAPAWEKCVLAGPPRIPYLHMTDIRSREWREEHGLSKTAAEERINRAIDIIDKTSNLSPIGIEVDGGEVRDSFSETRILHPNGGNVPFDPDYICFLAFSYLALSYVAQTYADAERVDFIIEKNGRITRYIQAFHSGITMSLRALGRPDLAQLVGELIPAGKERTHLQAADVLCWHTARPKETMDELDAQRYAKLARKNGMRARLDKDYIEELAAALTKP